MSMSPTAGWRLQATAAVVDSAPALAVTVTVAGALFNNVANPVLLTVKARVLDEEYEIKLDKGAGPLSETPSLNPTDSVD